MKRTIIATIIMTVMLAAAAPVAAREFNLPIQPSCEPPTHSMEADVLVCGDPRMWVRWENTGNQDTKVKWVFRDGNKKKGAKRRVVVRDIAAGDTIIRGPRWVLGNGALVKVKAWDPINEWWYSLLKFDNYRDGRWGQGDCPANRYGTPTWSDPTHSTR